MGRLVAGQIHTCLRQPMRARRSPTSSWRKVGSLRFPSAAAEANRMVFTMRASRPTARRGTRAIRGRLLPGADRALDDIKVAVDALQQRSDVGAGRILIGGVSRGGYWRSPTRECTRSRCWAFSTLSAGGWAKAAAPPPKSMARCFNEGENSTVRPYGSTVSTTAITRSNIAVRISTFSKKRAATVSFLNTQVRDGIGHALLAYPNLWSGDVEGYLTTIGALRAQ